MGREIHHIAQYAKYKPSERQKNGTKPSKPVFESEGVTMLWNQGAHTHIGKLRKLGQI
jgi:hypothetical protein